jgi:hypothetical protein
MKIVILFFLVQFVTNKLIQKSNYCFESKECSKEHYYKCSENICSKYKHSCKELKLWAMMIDHSKNMPAFREYEKFFQSIKKCPNRNPSNVCLNNAICYQTAWQIGKVLIHKRIKCKCIEKYNYTCQKDKQSYCSIDKEACQKLNATQMNIKNCKN